MTQQALHEDAPQTREAVHLPPDATLDQIYATLWDMASGRSTPADTSPAVYRPGGDYHSRGSSLTYTTHEWEWSTSSRTPSGAVLNIRAVSTSDERIRGKFDPVGTTLTVESRLHDEGEPTNQFTLTLLGNGRIRVEGRALIDSAMLAACFNELGVTQPRTDVSAEAAAA